MGFGGSAAAMIASLKANRRSRVSTFDKLKDFKKRKKSELIFPKKATKKDLETVREKIQKQNNNSFYKKVGLILIALIFLFYIIILADT